ncbi:hypothetical protein WCE12_00950 [Acinetobacter radioresistens]|uniref:hypothetical protein n=1 Tax=Acinetobacter radioresistens TaxID=40216 RepID=UPI0034D4B182
MNSLKLVFLGLGFTGLLTACTTTYQAQPNLDTYLEQFIGQSAEQIKAKINLPALGYELKGSPVQTANQLSYTILRPLAVTYSVWPAICRHRWSCHCPSYQFRCQLL